MRSLKRAALPFACVLVTSANARADALTIESMEHGAWSETIAALQTDARSESTTVRVVVRDGDGRALPCGTYGLALDAAGDAAFTIGACETASRATPLTLVRRSALFDHDARDGTSRPRTIRVVATRVESASAHGGARVEAQSAVSCSAEVTPYMPDLEHGTRVPLRPGRYALRALDAGVRVSHDDARWTLAKDGASAGAIDYELVDTDTGSVVLRDHVVLACGGARAILEPAPAVHVVVPSAAFLDGPHDATAPKQEDGTEWALALRGGLAVLRPGGMTFTNTNGATSADALGVRDSAGTGAGLAFVYERSWIYTSLAFDFAYAGVADRSLYAVGGTSVIAPGLRIGSTRLYAGPSASLAAYQLTAVKSSHFEWGTKPEIGLGAAAGLRLDLRGEGSTTYTLGFDVVAPAVGHQPFFALLSLGWGATH